MRQSGILAAAGLFALQNNRERLVEDHLNAKYLAGRISANPNLEINLESVQTNILLFTPKTVLVEEGILRCKEKGLLFSVGKVNLIRGITHLDVSMNQIEKAADILDEVFI